MRYTCFWQKCVEVKWSKDNTADGYTVVEQWGGCTLGLMALSGTFSHGIFSAKWTDTATASQNFPSVLFSDKMGLKLKKKTKTSVFQGKSFDLWGVFPPHSLADAEEHCMIYCYDTEKMSHLGLHMTKLVNMIFSQEMYKTGLKTRPSFLKWKINTSQRRKISS